MRVVIINGSPRTRQYSNTDKIIKAFVKGLETGETTYELYSLSSRKEWDSSRSISYKREDYLCLTDVC